jgi:outer membrane receptor for ferric coprogen and ferric-rhodotorulic acid
VKQGPYGLLNANVSWKSSDGKYTLMILGTNLANKAYFENIGISPLSDNGIWGMPRYVAGRFRYSF